MAKLFEECLYNLHELRFFHVRPLNLVSFRLRISELSIFASFIVSSFKILHKTSSFKQSETTLVVSICLHLQHYAGSLLLLITTSVSTLHAVQFGFRRFSSNHYVYKSFLLSYALFHLICLLKFQCSSHFSRQGQAVYLEVLVFWSESCNGDVISCCGGFSKRCE